MNGDIKGSLIVIGDTHFGIKRFSLDALKNQILFFEKQVFPYMLENNIKEIFQLGDLFDNRTTVDILFLDYIKKHFFGRIDELGFKLHSLIGNHDIAYRESREVSLVKFFSDLYPKSFILYEDRTYITINGNSTYIVPWIVKGEDLTYEEIKDSHNILGHFEIRHFAMVKGHNDTTAKLTTDFFTKNTKVRNVFSGHYHLKNTSGLVKYLGTPTQINWSDYGEEKGFYVWHEDDFLEFIENTTSKKYIKVKYNDTKEKNIEVSGLFKHSKLFNEEEFNTLLPSIEKHDIKFFINDAKDRNFDEVIYNIKEANVKATIIDNQELSNIIGTTYTNEDSSDNKDTRTIVIDAITENKKELLPLLLDIFKEIDTKILKDV